METNFVDVDSMQSGSATKANRKNSIDDSNLNATPNSKMESSID
jgi:hypothetical protein